MISEAMFLKITLTSVVMLGLGIIYMLATLPNIKHEKILKIWTIVWGIIGIVSVFGVIWVT